MHVEQHIYTSCPRGKGYDGIDGYQTKARSSGLSDAMVHAIRHYCEHYRLPHTVRDLERKVRQEGHTLPDHFWTQCPVAWMYYPIENDVFALTRTCYVGQGYTGSFGIFFAHTLVFPVETLRPLRFNPLALTRTTLFESQDTSDRTTRPTRPDFHDIQVQDDPHRIRVATDATYAGQLADLLTAVSGVPQHGRPVILCLPRWEHAVHLIETLLLLLPPEARCRTPFVTYEHDPYRLLRTGNSGSSLQASPHIIVTPRRGEGAFEFRPEEYQNKFYIFNFVEQQPGPRPKTSAYAQYVVDCSQHGDQGSVTALQELVTSMEVGLEPQQWDVLFPAIDLKTPEMLSRATAALLAVAQRPTQAQTAITRLWPTIEQLAHHGPHMLLEQTMGAYKQLWEHLPADAPEREQRQHELSTLMSQLLQEGHVRSAGIIPTVLAPLKARLLAAALDQVVQESWPSKRVITWLAGHAEDRTLMPALLADGVEAMHAQAMEPQRLATVIGAACKVTGQTGGLPALWARIGPDIVQPLLTRLPQAAAFDFAERLLAICSNGACPDGMLAVKLWQWQVKKPQSVAQCEAEAVVLGQIAAQCTEPGQAIDAVLKQVRQFYKASDYPVMIAAMSQQPGAGASVEQVLCQAYDQALADIPQEESRWDVRKHLAKRQFARMLAYDCFHSLLPWTAASQGWVHRWAKDVFGPNIGLLSAIVANLATRLEHHQSAQEAVTLAGAFLQAMGVQGNRVRQDVYTPMIQVAVSRLPLAPVGAPWQQILAQTECTDWSAERQNRFRMLRLLNDIERQSREAGWSATGFPDKFPTWFTLTGRLAKPDRHTATQWLLGTFGAVGVSLLPDACADASALFQLVSQPEDGEIYRHLAQLVTRHAEGRGLVSQVIRLSAFALLGMEASDAHRRDVVAGFMAMLLADVGRPVRNAFWEYLAERPESYQHDWSQRLQTFRNLVETTAPAALPRGHDKSPARSGTLVDMGEKASGWLRGVFRRER